MSRRVLVLAIAGFLTVLLAAVAALLPVPYVALQPGPTTNTLGKVAGTPLIRIDGHPTYPVKGHLDLVTVSVLGGPRQRLDLVTALKGWIDHSIAVVPETTVYPKGQTAAQAERESATEMTDSQENATTAALHQLGIPVTTRTEVTRLPANSPSQGKLRQGDVVVSVDGTPITGGASLQKAVRARQAGDELAVVVKRDGKQMPITVTAGSAQGHTVLGVEIRDQSDYPFKVDISLQDVGGPSAGMMFALGIIDKLTPGPLTGGKFIAGTGTIDDLGRVGAIGGISQKMIGARHNGATVFLAPAANCGEARRTVPDGLRLVKVRTLNDAVTALDNLRAGRTSALPAC